MRPSITTIINTCSGDRNFLLENVKAIREISDEIIVPYCNHLYSGAPDDMAKMQIAKNACKPYDVKFIEFDKVVGSPLGQNTARWVGTQASKTDYILYMDADEIFEKDKIDNWVNNFDYSEFNAITFSIHFYSMAQNLRAALNEEEGSHYVGPRTSGRLYARGEKAGLLVNSKIITKERIMNGPERWIIVLDPTVDKKKEHVLAMDGSIMLHHYAYVRSKQEMLRKVAGFSHSHEKPWVKLIDQYFKSDFKFDTTKHLDMCHGYILKEVNQPHQIPSIEEFDSIYG